jgi:hypothetical protein
MQEQSSEYKKLIRKAERLAYTAIFLMAICIGLLFLKIYDPTLSIFQPKKELLAEVDEDIIENGIHTRTGFVDAIGLMTVVNNCTNCHSSQLVIQNRMNEERWNATIKWMQETQNLWGLGDNQKITLR